MHPEVRLIDDRRAPEERPPSALFPTNVDGCPVRQYGRAGIVRDIEARTSVIPGIWLRQAGGWSRDRIRPPAISDRSATRGGPQKRVLRPGHKRTKSQ